MAFDGVDYGSGELIYPMSYHPNAPLTGDVIARALQSLYSLGRHQSQTIMHQSYAFNPARPELEIASGLTAIVQSDYVPIASCYAYIPAEATHVVADVHFLALPIEQSTAYHRVVVGSATGTATELTVQPQQHGGALDIMSGRSLRDYANAATRDASLVGRVRCEVNVSALTRDAEFEVHVEGYLYASFVGTYRPTFVTAWWEVRG